MSRQAVTLAELVVVLFILVALAGLATPLCSGQMSTAANTTTQATLAQARDAVAQYWRDTKFIALDGVTTAATEAERFDIEWLLFNPVTADRTLSFDRNTLSGWNGPYVLTATTSPDAVTDGLIDGWNRSLVVHYVNPGSDIRDVRIVSAGPDGVIDISAVAATSSLTTNNVGDDLYVSLLLR